MSNLLETLISQRATKLTACIKKDRPSRTAGQALYTLRLGNYTGCTTGNIPDNERMNDSWIWGNFVY